MDVAFTPVTLHSVSGEVTIAQYYPWSAETRCSHHWNPIHQMTPTRASAPSAWAMLVPSNMTAATARILKDFKNAPPCISVYSILCIYNTKDHQYSFRLSPLCTMQNILVQRLASARCAIFLTTWARRCYSKLAVRPTCWGLGFREVSIWSEALSDSTALVSEVMCPGLDHLP